MHAHLVAWNHWYFTDRAERIESGQTHQGGFRAILPSVNYRLKPNFRERLDRKVE